MFQLVYMWIEDFRTLKDVNLNFHSNFEFEFEPIKRKKVKLSDGEEKESVVKGKLRIKKFNPNDRFVNEYFPENQFISLIVGKNGTGKTSVFELLEDLEKKDRYISNNTLFYFKDRFYCIFLDKENKEFIFWGAEVNKKNVKTTKIKLNQLSKDDELLLELPPLKVNTQEEKRELKYTYFSLPPKFRILLISKEFKKWYQKPLGNSWGEEFKSNYLKDNHSFLRNLFKCDNLKFIIEIMTVDKYTKLPDTFIIKIHFNSIKPYDFNMFIDEIKKSKLPKDKKSLIFYSIDKLEHLHQKIINFEDELNFFTKVKAILLIYIVLDFLYNLIKNYSESMEWDSFLKSNQFKEVIKSLYRIEKINEKKI